MNGPLDLPAEYPQLLAEIKQRIRRAQTRVMLSASAELIQLYWEIGSLIDARQRRQGWGARVIPQLARDLRSELPDEKGFSERNIDRMLAFYREYSDVEFSPQLVAKTSAPGQTLEISPQPAAKFPGELLLSVPWSHHDLLRAKVKDPATRAWYMRASIENGWSRSVLLAQIQTGAHERAGQAVTNFGLRLPPPDSDLARQALKDPYILDFLTISDDFRERELEAGLIAHMERFLIELGQGFAFVGRQHHLKLGDRDFYLDLLFYHLKLRRYVVVEIKRGEFQAEYAGKVNLYCNLVDDQLRHPNDAPTIGLILCQEPDRLFAEYTLRGIDKPIGVSGYELTRALPAELEATLPTIEQIEAELQGGAE
ncbi:PDDEXK nuclease domain-containing protein [Myceligenerans crystallogenes]|uniref:PDDEXK nuclease domain-containing protein n=1 Tax=Myceligenerans crystallogenes TaxID=316335 RepID=A0ABN2N9F6_9MICO